MSWDKVHIEDKLFSALGVHVGMGMYLPTYLSH